uniref:Uncharacterized protein n=1 Tax=Globodera pallida TaxID=36090 RepID=A0A183BUM9_GLOPA
MSSMLPNFKRNISSNFQFNRQKMGVLLPFSPRSLSPASVGGTTTLSRRTKSYRSAKGESFKCVDRVPEELPPCQKMEAECIDKWGEIEN